MINRSPSDLTIAQTIQYWSQCQPDKIAFHVDSSQQSYTYYQLNQRLAQYGKLFDSLNIPPHSVIGLMFINSTSYLELLLATYYHQRIALPINLVAGTKAIQHAISHSEPKVIFTQTDYNAYLTSDELEIACPIIQLTPHQSPLEQLSAESLESAVEPTVESTETPQPNIQNTPDDPALLMYTSGTTGTPKGVLLSHKNLLQGGYNTALAHQLTPQDTGLCLLPLYHINAQCVSLMSAIISGSSIVLIEKFSRQNFFESLSKYRISWASIVPTVASYILNIIQDKVVNLTDYNLESLKFIRSASAPLPIEVHQKFEQYLQVPIIETMGITETSAQILANPLPPKPRKIGSVGLPFGNQVVILDKQQQPLPANQIGEIAIHGDNVIQSYYKNPQATQQSFTHNGWFLSGDLGFQDEDGYITVTGRKKELIIKGGENIAPREIDEILYSHADVIEAAAFAKADTRYGQTIEAAVAIASQSQLTEQQLINLCQQKLGKFKTPDKIHFMDELPKGASGKIQRLKLSEQHSSTTA